MVEATDVEMKDVESTSGKDKVPTTEPEVKKDPELLTIEGTQYTSSLLTINPGFCIWFITIHNTDF